MIESYKKRAYMLYHHILSPPVQKTDRVILWIDETPSKKNIFGIYGLMGPHIKSSICGM
jgi:hypothetical protein